MSAKSKKGAALIEYGLLLGLISIVGVGSVSVLGGVVATELEEVSATISEVGIGATPGYSDGQDEGAQPEIVQPSPGCVPSSEIPADATTCYVLVSGTHEVHQFDDATDIDWWELVNDRTQDVQFVLDGFGGDAFTIDGQLIGMGMGLSVSQGNAFGNDVGLVVNDLPAGRYFVSARARTSYVGDYRIAANIVEDTNDSVEGAHALALNTPRVESFIRGDRGDYYRITVPEGSDIHVLVENVGDAFPKNISLRNADGTAIEDRTSASWTGGVVGNNLPAGDYYIRVWNGAPGNSYRVSANTVSDPSDDLARPGTVNIGDSISSTILPGDDADWYRLDLPASHVVTLSSSSPLNDRMSHTLRIRDAAGDVLANSGNAHLYKQDLSAALAAGTYYIEVHPTYLYPTTKTYDLSVQ